MNEDADHQPYVSSKARPFTRILALSIPSLLMPKRNALSFHISENNHTAKLAIACFLRRSVIAS